MIGGGAMHRKIFDSSGCMHTTSQCTMFFFSTPHTTTILYILLVTVILYIAYLLPQFPVYIYMMRRDITWCALVYKYIHTSKKVKKVPSDCELKYIIYICCWVPTTCRWYICILFTTPDTGQYTFSSSTTTTTTDTSPLQYRMKNNNIWLCPSSMISSRYILVYIVL